MISIIIPLYNNKEYVKQAIESVLHQTFTDIELIVIDDGSTDGVSVNHIQIMNDKIRYYKQKNRGTGEARNLGLSKALGEYIFFLDADDCLEPNALELLYNNIFNRDFVIAKCKRRFIDKNERIYKEEIWKEKIYHSNLDKYTLVVDTISTNKLYKKKFLLDNNIIFESGSHEDILFVVKIFEATVDFSFINQALYCWNIRDKLTTRSSVLNIDTLEQRIEVLDKCIAHTKDIKLKQAIIDNAIVHDLKRYVYCADLYTYNEQVELYRLYKSFVQKYEKEIYLSDLKENEEKSIQFFVRLSQRHNAGKFYLKKIISHDTYVYIHKINLFFKNSLRLYYAK